MANLKLPDIDTYLEARAITLGELHLFIRTLEAKETRSAAIALLHELASKVSCDRKEGLRLVTPTAKGLKPLRLFLHPAVFQPEGWSQTFAEGLLEDAKLFERKTVVELGSGSGWISLLLVTQSHVVSVLGVDLNPIAVAMATLNAWLNGTDADATLKKALSGSPIVDVVRFEQSDLLQQPVGRHEHFDHVIGCIPQVLHPDPTNQKRQRRTSTEALYELSNYCLEEGIFEDSFGLTLVAKALEQAHLCLKPEGLVTMNLGGRPGLDVIEGVFNRRGYDASLRCSRRVQQAADTDLASLVAYEKEHGIRFHLYLSEKSEHSVSASVAVAHLEKGETIYHDLFVVQGACKF